MIIDKTTIRYSYLINGNKLQIISSTGQIVSEIEVDTYNAVNIIVKKEGKYIIVYVSKLHNNTYYIYTLVDDTLTHVSTINVNTPFTDRVINNFTIKGKVLIYIDNENTTSIDIFTKKTSIKTHRLISDIKPQLLVIDTGIYYLVRIGKICSVVTDTGKVIYELPKEVINKTCMTDNVYVEVIGRKLYVVVLDKSSLFNTRDDFVINLLTKKYETLTTSIETKRITLGKSIIRK